MNQNSNFLCNSGMYVPLKSADGEGLGVKVPGEERLLQISELWTEYIVASDETVDGLLRKRRRRYLSRDLFRNPFSFPSGTTLEPSKTGQKLLETLGHHYHSEFTQVF